MIASSGLDTTSLRIGQISGSTNGAWAASDWVPILVKSGLALECLPCSHGVSQLVHYAYFQHRR